MTVKLNEAEWHTAQQWPPARRPASHAFDNPLGAQPAAVSPTFESARNCKIREEADGLLINVETKQPFTYKDACVERDPHLGYDLNAT